MSDEEARGPLDESPSRLRSQVDRQEFPAWEQIEIGRYRPRRIRGSFPGRELG
jgi:hypothetical protein